MEDNECELKSLPFALMLVAGLLACFVGERLRHRAAKKMECMIVVRGTIFVSNEVSFSLVFVRFSFNSSFH